MMIRRPITRRPGLSLVEVLVGFGIMGVGVTSVITLFPFSALTLGQALRDDRTTTAAVTADGFLRDYHTRYVVEVGNGSPEPYHTRMDDPQTGAPALAQTDLGPSYPVLIDPMGVAASRGPLGDSGQTLIPRVSLNLIGGNPSLALRLCSQMDGLSFTEDGTVPTATTFDKRELRYNWLWVVQRPVNRDRYTVRMQVVVFNKRAHLYTPPGSEAVYGNVRFTPGETAIYDVPATAEIRKGSWVMDAGILPAGATAGSPNLRHAEFYRVLSVTEVGGTYALEVHKPVSRPDGQAGAYTGNLVVMPAVADVFERPVMTAASGR